MKTKNTSVYNTAVFLGLIGVLTIGNITAPKKDFSENENRTLAKTPELSIRHIFGGNFDDDFETWFSDHFMERDFWIASKSFLRKASGAIENNDVYYAKDSHLIRRFPSVNSKIVDRNILLLEEFADTTGTTPNVLLVPTASYSNASLLPAGAYDIDQGELLEEIYAQMPYAHTVDLEGKLSAGDNYFRTDHHWNADGAAIAYEAIASQVLHKSPESFGTTVVSSEFYGTMYSRSGAFWTGPDSIVRIDPLKENNEKVQVQVTYEDGTVTDSLYFENRLEEKDKYTYYLDGNHAHLTIETDVENDRNAVIVKDSYAHILLPYLVSEYTRIEVIDLRYYHDSVSELLDEQSDVYFIYNLENFCEDPNMVFLK